MSSYILRFSDVRARGRVFGGRSVTAERAEGIVADLRARRRSILALSDVEVNERPAGALEAVARERPTVARAFDGARVPGDAHVRPPGRRPRRGRGARVRVAHCLYDLHPRLRKVDLVSGSGYVLPLDRQDIASICGLSLVHTNKTLRHALAGIVRLESGRVEIADAEVLRGSNHRRPADASALRHRNAWCLAAGADLASVPGVKQGEAALSPAASALRLELAAGSTSKQASPAVRGAT